MFYEFESADGEKTTISCSDDGAIVYTVGNRKAEFSLMNCGEYDFEFLDGTSCKVTCGEDGVDQLFLIVLYGERQLESNNNKQQTRRHDSMSEMPDKYNEIVDRTVCVEDEALRNLDAVDLRRIVGKLKPDEQKLVHRLYLGEHTVSQSELALELGVTENTIKQRIKHIRTKIKRML